MTAKYPHLYGPVPSRRLGLSLGVDIVPAKACTLDCIYCQVGLTTDRTALRQPYIPIETIINELQGRICEGLTADFITVTGAGEPTLHSQLGTLIDGIRAITDIPVAVITNGTLLHRSDVRDDCAKADVVLPSLDAGTEETFLSINRPAEGITFQHLIEGLVQFRGCFSGKMWLEVFLAENINTSPQELDAISALISKISPDKVHLNTAVRPTAEKSVGCVDPARLAVIARQLAESSGVPVELAVASTARSGPLETAESVATDNERTIERVFSMLKRRPCSARDVAAGLGISEELAAACIDALQKRGALESSEKAATIYYQAASPTEPTD